MGLTAAERTKTGNTSPQYKLTRFFYQAVDTGTEDIWLLFYNVVNGANAGDPIFRLLVPSGIPKGNGWEGTVDIPVFEEDLSIQISTNRDSAVAPGTVNILLTTFAEIVT